MCTDVNISAQTVSSISSRRDGSARSPAPAHRRGAHRAQLPEPLARCSRQQVDRARALLATADGASYTAAAHLVSRRHNETISAWVSRFDREGHIAISINLVSSTRYGRRYLREPGRLPGTIHPQYLFGFDHGVGHLAFILTRERRDLRGTAELDNAHYTLEITNAL